MKKTFLTLFVIAAIVLVTLPFLTTFTDFLTNLIMKVGIYRAFQDIIVPYEIKLMGTLLHLLGIPVAVGNAFVSLQVGGREEVIYLAWNCVGWQTFLLFAITLVTGLAGSFTLISKLETLLFGFLGTYLLNIVRIAFVVGVYHLLGRPLGIVFHDYFSIFLTLGWLFLFWWFSYSFILEGGKKAAPSLAKPEDTKGTENLGKMGGGLK